MILWDARRDTRLTDRPMAVAGGGNVFGVAFSSDGSTTAGDFRRHPLISGVVLWDARRGVQLAERALEDGKSLSRIVFSPDGKTLAGGYGYYKAEDGYAAAPTTHGPDWIRATRNPKTGDRFPGACPLRNADRQICWLRRQHPPRYTREAACEGPSGSAAGGFLL